MIREVNEVKVDFLNPIGSIHEVLKLLTDKIQDDEKAINELKSLEEEAKEELHGILDASEESNTDQTLSMISGFLLSLYTKATCICRDKCGCNPNNVTEEEVIRYILTINGENPISGDNKMKFMAITYEEGSDVFESKIIDREFDGALDTPVGSKHLLINNKIFYDIVSEPVLDLNGNIMYFNQKQYEVNNKGERVDVNGEPCGPATGSMRVLWESHHPEEVEERYRKEEEERLKALENETQAKEAVDKIVDTATNIAQVAIDSATPMTNASEADEIDDTKEETYEYHNMFYRLSMLCIDPFPEITKSILLTSKHTVTELSEAENVSDFILATGIKAEDGASVHYAYIYELLKEARENNVLHMLDEIQKTIKENPDANITDIIFNASALSPKQEKE